MKDDRTTWPIMKTLLVIAISVSLSSALTLWLDHNQREWNERQNQWNESQRRLNEIHQQWDRKQWDRGKSQQDNQEKWNANANNVLSNILDALTLQKEFDESQQQVNRH